jgi:hypothetical protein
MIIKQYSYTDVNIKQQYIWKSVAVAGIPALYLEASGRISTKRRIILPEIVNHTQSI